MLKNTDKNLTKGLILTILGAIAWGFSGTCGQYLMNYKNVDSTYLANVRLIFGGLLLIIFAIFKYKKDAFRIFKNKKDTITLILFGVLGMLFSQFAYLQAIYYTNAPTATTLQFLSSIFIVLITCFKENRLPKKIEILAILLAILGTFTLSTHLDISKLVINPLGLVWALISALGIVACTLLPLEIMPKYTSFVVNGFGMFFGGIALSIFTKPWNITVNFDTGIILGFIGIVLIGTILAFSFFLYGVTIIGPVKGSLIAGLESVSALIFSVLFLKEIFSLYDILGMALILFAVSALNFIDN
ncbi:drug/metabolite transporter (DMT)-like permease [Peptoniphilus stercorisuis]|uniref:Drug/metabolite transporter (DMT)-like permease n=1 Tax=Peptoniphilus stercorisuis TaxID=1436965 RepID=A0ABS4KCD9_9FIRM|nr:drug/metabolite transporter (DMT)-like permease [Peptoniphilus stercorisuis]